MINNEKLAQIKTMVAGGESVKSSLTDLSPEDLYRLRDEIDALLPRKTLSDFDLTSELVEQYNRVKLLQAEVLDDSDIPANQRAQVAGQVASTLQQLVKMQAEFHTSERFKAIENLMIKYMKRLPKEVAEKFIDEYEALE